MAEVKFIKISTIVIPETRFRKQFSEKTLTELQDSISNGPGLINAITIKNNMELNTGETRMRAVSILHEIGLPVFYHGEKVPEGCIPAIIIENELQEIDYLKAELHENTHRESFTYVEEAQAIAKIARIQQALIDAERAASEPEKQKPKFLPLGIPLKEVSPEAVKQTAERIYDGKAGAHYSKSVQDSLLIANAIENAVPELSDKLLKAKDKTEAQKILKSHALEEQRASLAMSQGKTFGSSRHKVIHGCCLEELKKLESASIDVCCTDPIYGIGAGNFGNSGGRMSGFSHDYDDSLENFEKIMPQAIKELSRVLKPKAHIYLACDIRNLQLLKDYLKATSPRENPWYIPSAPFIQYKLAGGRVPHPGFTPRRSYELWLYAYRGGKEEYRLINDVIECESDRSETHGAGKPKDLLKVFLNRSCLPGDTVLDFMAGSGSILPAAHELKLKVTAIEINPSYYGRCIERLKELK